MFQFKKFVEGIAVIDDDTGASRLMSPAELETLYREIPQISERNVASWFTDELPEGIEKPQR